MYIISNTNHGDCYKFFVCVMITYVSGFINTFRGADEVYCESAAQAINGYTVSSLRSLLHLR